MGARETRLIEDSLRKEHERANKLADLNAELQKKVDFEEKRANDYTQRLVRALRDLDASSEMEIFERAMREALKAQVEALEAQVSNLACQLASMRTRRDHALPSDDLPF